MEIMSEFDMVRGKYYNALNDIRKNGGYTFNIASGTHFLFTWDNELKLWVFQPRKFYFDMKFPVHNDSVLVRIPAPDKSCKAVTAMVEDMSDVVMAHEIVNMFDTMWLCPPPASMKTEVCEKKPRKKRRND